MDLALNNIQRLICHRTQPTNHPTINCMWFEVKKILGKYQDGFRGNWSTTSQIVTMSRIIEGVHVKNLEATLLFEDFSKAFGSMQIRKNTANTTSIWFPRRKCYCYNDALQKYENSGSLTRWWHRLHWYCHWSRARRYTSTVHVHNLLKLRTSNNNLSNKIK